MKVVPPILHVSREAREVRFGLDRVMASGRQDTDVDTYTTCPHEVSAEGQGRGVHWRPEIDTVYLHTSEWMNDDAVAYVWGEKTGVSFEK